MAKKKASGTTVTEIKYARRRNLGDFQHEELSVTGQIAEGSDIAEEINAMKTLVTSALEGDEEALDKVEDSGTKKVKKAKKKKAVKEEPEDEDEEESEEDEDEEESEEDEEDESEDEDEEEEEAPKAKGKKGSSAGKVLKATPSEQKKTSKLKTKVRSKSTVYDRENDLHKKLIGELLDTTHPKWNAKEKLTKRAVKASKKLHGEDFMDKSGNILPSFEEALMEAMEG